MSYTHISKRESISQHSLVMNSDGALMLHMKFQLEVWEKQGDHMLDIGFRTEPLLEL